MLCLAHKIQDRLGNGDTTAQLQLSDMLFNGKGGESDYVNGFKWAKLAADSGDMTANSLLGFYYENGIGVTPARVKVVVASVTQPCAEYLKR